MEVKRINLNYIAGLFDGEGWFRINRGKGIKSRTNRKHYFQAYAHLCMREKYIIEILPKLFGGSITFKKGRKSNHSDTWQWNATCKALDKFIEKMDDKILGKNKQLQVIKRFRYYAKRAANLSMTNSRYKIYIECFNTIKRLNKKGVGK